MKVFRANARAGMLHIAGLLGAFCGAAAHALEYRQQHLPLEGGTLQQVTLPAGYTLELLTTKLDGPRLLTFADNGDLFIGSKSGKVYRLAPPYTDPGVLITLNDYPHSVASTPGRV